MLVIFRKKAFLDKLYKPSSSPQEVSEEYRGKLPRDAVVIEEKDLAAFQSRKPGQKQVALSELARGMAEKPAVTGLPGDQRTSGGLDEAGRPVSDNTRGMSKDDPTKPAVDPQTLSEMNKLLPKDRPDDDDDEDEAPVRRAAPDVKTAQERANASKDARDDSKKGADEVARKK